MPQTIDNMSVTWTNSLTTYTGIKLNAAGSSDANSAAASLLMDLQVGGASRFSVSKGGNITTASGTFFDSAFYLASGSYTNNNSIYAIRQSSANVIYLTLGYEGAVLSASKSLKWAAGNADGSNQNGDLILTRRAAANLRLGAADTTGTTAPTPQTLSVQSWTSSTNNNQPGANFTIAGSQGTGTGAGGSIIFQVAPAGAVSNGVQNALATALTINSNRSVNFQGPLFDSTNNLTFGAANANVVAAVTTSSSTGNPSSLALANSYALAWGSTSNPLGALDVLLYRDNSGVLALRNGANPQTFRVYNTTDGTNSEWFNVLWSGNDCYVGTDRAVSGVGRALYLQTSGTARWLINTSGHWLSVNDGSYDIGATSSGRPRNVYLTGQVVTGNSGIAFGSNASLSTTSAGILVLSPFNSIVGFGGTTSSFPALKRNSTALETKLADDSAYAPHAMQYLDVTDGVTAPASATGRARIYVDTADGDLKVIFADGTVKTIVTDT